MLTPKLYAVLLVCLISVSLGAMEQPDLSRESLLQDLNTQDHLGNTPLHYCAYTKTERDELYPDFACLNPKQSKETDRIKAGIAASYILNGAQSLRNNAHQTPFDLATIHKEEQPHVYAVMNAAKNEHLALPETTANRDALKTLTTYLPSKTQALLRNDDAVNRIQEFIDKNPTHDQTKTLRAIAKGIAQQNLQRIACQGDEKKGSLETITQPTQKQRRSPRRYSRHDQQANWRRGN